MTGAEAGRLLAAACDDAGLTAGQKSRVLACFALRLGQRAADALDLAMYEQELRPGTGQGLSS